MKLKLPIKKLPVKKVIIGAVGIIVIVGGIKIVTSKVSSSKTSTDSTVKTGTVSRQIIQSSLSSSGTISPKDSYTITSMVDGQVISADFEEGDVVTEGQVLYQIDSSSMTSKLKSAKSSLERSQDSYNDAVDDYNTAVSDFSGNTVKSDYSGHIKSININIGDQVSASTEIAEIYDDSTMKIDVPFLSVEAALIPVGNTATVILDDTLEELVGVVTSVDSMETTLTGGQLVRYVTVEVANPGGLTTDMAATATINGMNSSGDAYFEAAKDFTIKATNLSSSVTVAQILVSEGDYVSAGQALFVAEADDIEDIIDNYKDKVDSAESSVESAQSSLDSTSDTYDEYTITAPIAGTVVTKSANVGENVQNGSSATSLAVIYDLTEVTFDMNIDELDISNVSVGQTVEVTADAFEDETFTGTVTKISMEGTSSNGVTYYPVTVTMTDFGGLLPGMNVEGVIILDEAENALAIPVDALQRGNKVYVKNKAGETYTEEEDTAEAAPTGSGDAPAIGTDGAPSGDNTKSDPATANASGDTQSSSDDASTATKSSASNESFITKIVNKIKGLFGISTTSTTANTNSNVPDGFHSVSVETGLTSDSYVEILSGDLEEGDEVYISQSTVSSSDEAGMFMMGGQGGGQGGPGGGQGGPSGGGGGGRSGGGGGGPM